MERGERLRMKLRKPVQIDEKKFFALGKYAFFISAIMMLAGLIDNFGNMAGSGIIRQIAMIIFNFGLMGYFGYMLDKEKETVTDKDAEQLALEDFDKLKKKK